MTANVSSTVSIDRDLYQSLVEIAQHFGSALDMSDSDHPDFADSGADIVEHLWLKEQLVRQTLAKLDSGSSSAKAER